MGTKYTTTAVVGYNSTPPADDGTASDANKIKWSTIKTKLPDPLNTAIAAIDTKLVDYVNVGPVAKTTTYTTVAGDNNKTLECSGTFTVSLMDAASAGAGYTVEINNQGTGTITVSRITAGDTINTVAGNVTLAAKVSMTFRVIAAATGYAIIAIGRNDFGTAAFVNTGTSGATVPLLNAANTFSGQNTFSTNQKFTGAIHVTNPDGSEKILFFLTGTSRRWALFSDNAAESGSNVGSDFGVYPYSDADVALARCLSIQRSTGAIQIGAPTGGYKTAGTINAVGVYDDNTLLTCYVMAAEKGDLTLDKWDAATPDLHIPERRHEKDGKVTVIPEVNETRIHGPARKFFARADELLDPKKYTKAWKKDGHLPTMPSPAEWEESGKKMTLGTLVQKLWETVEVQAVHIAKLEARISSLGG